MKTKNPREAAYLALLSASKEEGFISDILEKWRESASPGLTDYHLAQQIAFGTSQRMMTLDYLAEQMCDNKKLSLKGKERLLLRLALYQYYFLDRIPIYAIANESLKLAHKYCHQTFTKFLNAILRKLAEHPLKLPKGNSPEALSVRFSYPLFFIRELLNDYGLETTEQILEAQNVPAATMLRIRPNEAVDSDLMEPLSNEIAVLKKTSALPQIAKSSAYYIQNITPATLIKNLSEGFHPPQRILDLCASPGGKLLAAHDQFPAALLYANDISEEKIMRLKENCLKYHLNVSVSCGRGEAFTSSEPFDLIILDVPCSNTGVLNKRPEARWRQSAENLRQLEEIQMQLLANARKLLSPHGEIWYLTCSILKKENELLIGKACSQLHLKVRHQQTLLPNSQGWDGGFSCALKATHD